MAYALEAYMGAIEAFRNSPRKGKTEFFSFGGAHKNDNPEVHCPSHPVRVGEPRDRERTVRHPALSR